MIAIVSVSQLLCMCIYAICSYVSMCSCLSKMLTHTLIYIYMYICKEKKKPDRRVAVVIATVQPCFSPVPRFLFFFCHMGIEKEKKISPLPSFMSCAIPQTNTILCSTV